MDDRFKIVQAVFLFNERVDWTDRNVRRVAIVMLPLVKNPSRIKCFNLLLKMDQEKPGEKRNKPADLLIILLSGNFILV